MDENLAEFFHEVRETIKSRGKSYDTPENNFAKIARAWSDYLGFNVEVYDVAVMMALLKLARLTNGYHRDSLLDACAYLGIADGLSDDQ